MSTRRAENELAEQKKQPWIKFFVLDWRADLELRECSFAARGLWIDILTIMHQADPRGYLLLNAEAPTALRLAKMLGGTEREVSRLLAELENARVFSKTEQGVIYSRKMVRDEKESQEKARRGRMGGNPALKQKVAEQDMQKDDGLLKQGSLTPETRSQKPETRSQKPEARAASVERDWFDFLEEACMVAGMPPGKAANSTGLIAPWSRLGLTQAQILKIIGDAAKRPGYEPPRGLGYFTGQLTDAAKAITATPTLPAGKRPQTEAEKIKQLAINRDHAVKFHRRNPDMWPSGFGPPPDHPDCLASFDVLVEHGWRKPKEGGE